MHGRSMDRRPRILDFSARIDDARVSRSLAWPCHAFRVAIPVRPARRLNIFEETLLKILENVRLADNALAEMTCLDVSLVRLVCCRLRDLGMLTDHNEAAAPGRAYLLMLQDEGIEYELRTVFRERISGKLLPIVQAGELRYEELTGWNVKQHSAEIRKARRSVHLRLLRSPEGGDGIQPPTPAEVIWAAERHQELCRQYAVLRRGVAPCPSIVPARQMNVDPNPESVFLRCQAIIPTAEDDYRIGDPFGFGFSEILFSAYEGLRATDRDEQEFIRAMRDSSSTIRLRLPKSDVREREAEAAVLSRLADGVTLYPELFMKLRQAEKEFRHSSHAPKNSNEQAHFGYHAQQAAQSLSEALEEAMGQVATRWRPASSEALLCGLSQTHERNGELLERIARHLHLRTQGIKGLLKVAPGRIRGLREGGVVDLQALLAVVLAAAAEEPRHPLRRFGARFGDWLIFVRELKTMRDAGAHGQSAAAGSQRLGELLEGTYRSIELLLPGLQPNGAPRSAAGARPAMERAHDARRLAISRLEACFGVRWYARLDTGAAELLIQVELAADALSQSAGRPANVARTLNDLAAVLQTLVHAHQPAREGALGPSESPSETARKRALKAGLLLPGAELPRCLATVNPRRLEEALQGRNPTLGGMLLALLLVAPIDWLRRLAVAYPRFVALCARVLDQRGHGNRPVFMRSDELIELKDDVYNACKALMEI